MKVFDLETMGPLQSSVLTIGNFDGVHRAHQQLLAQAGMFASSTGGPVTVLTFDPHPLRVLVPERAPQRLCGPDEKLRLLEENGAEVVVIARTTTDLLAIEASRFIEELVVQKFCPTHIVEGPSFGFGRGRKGTPELLKRLGSSLGFEVHILEPMKLTIDGEDLMVSSSLVRQLLAHGKVRRAAMCLGRPYALTGNVIRGAGRGRTIGYPTANIGVEDQLIPCEGVYVGRTPIGGNRKHCAVSVGRTPTFGGSRLQVEAHVLDFSGDLYDQTFALEFLKLIRGQHKFASPEELIAQLDRDIAFVRTAGDSDEPLPTS